MPVYHVGIEPTRVTKTPNTDPKAVLLKLKPGVTKAQTDNFAATAKAMVGNIPGMLHPHSRLGAPADSDRSPRPTGGARACGERPQGQGLRYGFGGYFGESRRYWPVWDASCTFRVGFFPVSFFVNDLVAWVDGCRTQRLRGEISDDALAFDFEY